MKVAKKKEEEEEETETETEEAVSNNVRIHRVLEPVVERDTLQPSPSPSSNHSPYTYTPYSNNQTGIQSDNGLSRSLKILIASICCLFIVLIRGKWINRRDEREMEVRRINRRTEREMEVGSILDWNGANEHPSTGNTHAYHVYPSNGNDSREEVNINDTYPNYARNKSLPLSLSLEDRIELYSKAFNSNGNQLILKNKHIVSKINANKSDIEVCLDIEDTIKDDSSNSKNFIKESDTVEDASATTKMMTNGICSICIDEFIENDHIVYSELCSHVYHKHCMVSYLATNAQQEIHGSPTLDVTDNPCPSCRQPNYCQIRDEDLFTVLDTTSSLRI